ncbi:collagen alpha-1(XVIII) chain-like [Daphnia pulex]|uniref:collagen alpha-1(XVIII) chain-like n=1 Tax=Daphnia pulex TaxID=6669 RepID=UPI001EDC9A0F|nr:collagen alpha-1(XVIII) chain-like [Daphnia pulex]
MTRKMELPGKAVRKSSYWNRQIFYACCVLVLMAVAFAALYCGVLYGLKDDTELTTENNVTSSENRIPISPQSVEINPPTPPQPMSNSTTNADVENVPYVTEMIPAPTSSSKVMSGSQCVPRNLAYCNNTLNYTETVYPNLSGDLSEDDFVRSWAFLQTVIDSYCHPLIEQFVCQAAQPECRPNDKMPIGPCRQLCLEVAKACDPHIWSILEKEKMMFNCEQYAMVDDLNLCFHSMPVITPSYVNAKM